MLLLLLLCVCVCRGAQTPYVLLDNTERAPASLTSTEDGGGFTLCLGAQPSDKLRNSLLMCRELSYPFCVNSSLVGSVLQVDGETAKHFVQSLSEPTSENIEKLAWLVDSSLVLLYETFTSHSSAHLQCAHEWRNFVCARSFHRASPQDGLPLPACAETCRRAEDACDANLQCEARSELLHTEKCSDFFRDSTGVDCKSSSHKSSTKNTPVFANRPKHHQTWYSAASSAHCTLHINILLVALLAHFATQLVCR